MRPSPKPKVNILCAFNNLTGKKAQKKMIDCLDRQDPDTFRLIIDSGAYAVWSRGDEISMEAYMAFLKMLPSHWETKAVTLDVIGNPEETHANWCRMLDAGFPDIMPVFTRGDTLERLEEYYAATDYVMLGGVAGGFNNMTRNQNYIKWFVLNNKGRKTHWLGFIETGFVKRFKPYSVDSSSHMNAQRYADLSVYQGGARMATVNKFNAAAKLPGLREAFHRMGVSNHEIHLLRRNVAWSGTRNLSATEDNPVGHAAAMSCLSHVLRGIDVEKNLGTRVYFATNGPRDIKCVVESRDRLFDRGVI